MKTKALLWLGSLTPHLVVGATALETIKKLLTWFFGAGAIGLIIVGVIQIWESMAEANGGQRTRGIMLILGGLLLGGAAGLVQLLTAPPGV